MKFTSLFLLCIIFVTSLVQSSTVKQTFKSQKNALQQRIIGGSDAERYEFPYIVSLQFLKKHVCGGSIVSSNWVVTAGHCCDKRLLMFCSTYTVIAGMLNQEENHPDVQSVRVQKDILHPNYFYSGVEINNDIALLKLASPLKYTIAVQPVRLPNNDQTFSDGWLSGWGIHQRPSITPTTLQCLKMELISNEECKDVLSTFNPYDQLPLYNTMVCAMPPKGPESGCNGDSGGPFAKDGILIGVNSWAVWCQEYKVGAPTVFTRIHPYIDFINNHINN